MHNALLNFISKQIGLSQADTKLCNTYFEPITTNANCIIEAYNKVPQNLYFINSGFLRQFYHNDEGDEITTHLSVPNTFITSFLSFIHQTKATESVACVTACELLKISRPNLLALIEQSENFKQFSLIIFEQAISSTTCRANDLATLTAEQRYKKLMEQQPLLVQNVPVQYIASYLGIKPQSLSRIRRQIM